MGSWDGTLPAALPSGFVPTGAQWEAIRDAIAATTDPWNTYVPAWTGSTTNPVIGNGGLSGVYFRAGKTGVMSFSIDMGSTTTFGSGTYSIGLPSGWTSANSGVNRCCGAVGMRDNSGATHNTGFAFIGPNATSFGVRLNGGNVLTNTAPWTWAQSDFLDGTIILELV